MNISQALFAVTTATVEFTDSAGSPNDASRVNIYLAAHGGPQDLHVYFYVSGIPFSHFFAFSDQAFGNAKDDLWIAMLEKANIGSLDQPTDWDVDSLLGQIATYISIHSAQPPVSAEANAVGGSI